MKKQPANQLNGIIILINMLKGLTLKNDFFSEYSEISSTRINKTNKIHPISKYISSWLLSIYIFSSLNNNN